MGNKLRAEAGGSDGGEGSRDQGIEGSRDGGKSGPIVKPVADKTAVSPSVVDQQDPKVFIRLDDGTECETVTHEELNLAREFVYGTQYIDEQVVQYDAGGAPYFVLQDANYNLTGLTTGSGVVHQQYSFGPYGELLAAEDGSGTSIDFATSPQDIASPFGFHTAWYDAETGLICIRHRCYDPVTGRWMSADPNETGLVLMPSLVHSAETVVVHPSVIVDGQYGDGLNLYQFVYNNPIGFSDPRGTSLLGLLSSSATSGYIRATEFVAKHGTAARFVGGLLLAADIYAFAQFEEVQAVAVAQPNLVGLVQAQLAAARLALTAVARTAGSIRAVQRLTESGRAVAGAAKAWIKARALGKTGQLHHAISKAVWKALQRHPNLRGLYSYRDPRFVARAVDKQAHLGYQRWHRALDDEIAAWINTNKDATKEEFERMLRKRYKKLDLRAHFPDGFEE